jgi:hypothetical protein
LVLIADAYHKFSEPEGMLTAVIAPYNQMDGW